MPAPEDKLLVELLGPLEMHFRSARAAYRDYLESGRTFLFAKIIYRTNVSVRGLLMHKAYLLPSALQPEALALIKHYDVWLTLWEDLAQRTSPGLEDTFAFESLVAYPKSAELALHELYEKQVTHQPPV